MTHSKFLQALQAADKNPEPAEDLVLAYLTDGRVTLQVGNTCRPFHLDTDQAVELAQHIRALATGPEFGGESGASRDTDLLAPVQVPPGVTADPWRVGAAGHLVRTLSDGSEQRGNGDITTQCQHCTVPVNDGNVCAFCKSYTPPTSLPTIPQRLDDAVNLVDLVRYDLNHSWANIIASTPALSVTNVVTALGHLRQAALLIDQAAHALDAAAVTR